MRKEVPLQPAIDLEEAPRLGRLRQAALPVLLLSLAAWAVYGHTVSNGLMFDDRDTILNNTTIEQLENARLLFSRKDYFALFGEYSYRPVVTFSYFIDHAIGGKDPWIFHLHNVALHHLNVVLAFALFLILGAGRWQAFFIALVFALHPLAGEAVIFPGFREDLQMTAGMLAMSGFMALDRERPSILRLLGAALAYAYALFAKEAALLLPAAWLVFDFLFDRHALTRVNLPRRYVLLGLVMIGYIAVRFYIMANPNTGDLDVIDRLPLRQRFLTAPALFAYYLKRFVWPVPLCILSDFEPIATPDAVFSRAVMVVGIFVLVCVVFAWGRPWLWLAGFWIGATFAPVSNLYQIVNLWNERFYYSVNLGTAAIGVAAVGALGQTVGARLAEPQRRKAAVAAWAVAGGLIWLAAICSFVRILECRTPLSLWNATYRCMPENGIVLRNLARCELEAGNYARAEALAAEAEGVKGGGTWAANFIIGRSALLQGQYPRAIRHFEEAYEVEAPSRQNHTDLLRSLALACIQAGRYRSAELRLREAIEWDPEDKAALKLLKQIETRLGDDSTTPVQ